MNTVQPPRRAFFEFTDTTTIEAFWWWGDGARDIIAAVYRDAPDQPWRGRFRIRSYVDDTAWGSKDEKQAFEITGPHNGESDANRDWLTTEIERLIQMVGVTFAEGQATRYNIRGGTADFKRVTANAPWAHMKEENA